MSKSPKKENYTNVNLKNSKKNVNQNEQKKQFMCVRLNICTCLCTSEACRTFSYKSTCKLLSFALN